MKKSIIAFFLVLVMSIALTNVVFAYESVTVVLNEKELSQNGVLFDGRTLVPLRALGEALNATVSWDAGTQKITLVKQFYRVDEKTDAESMETRTVNLWIDKKSASVNGETDDLNAAPQLIDGVTMVPVRAISEWFEAGISWNADTKTVYVEDLASKSFAEAREINKSMVSSDEQTVTYDESTQWLSEDDVKGLGIIFVHGQQAKDLNVVPGFLKYDSSTKKTGDIFRSLPSFVESFAQGTSSGYKTFDGVTIKCVNGVLYFVKGEIENFLALEG